MVLIELICKSNCLDGGGGGGLVLSDYRVERGNFLPKNELGKKVSEKMIVAVIIKRYYWDGKPGSDGKMYLHGHVGHGDHSKAFSLSFPFF